MCLCVNRLPVCVSVYKVSNKQCIFKNALTGKSQLLVCHAVQRYGEAEVSFYCHQLKSQFYP